MDESSSPMIARASVRAVRGAPTAPGAVNRTDDRRARTGLALVAVIAVALVITTVFLTSGPRPDATLHQIAQEPDVEVLAMLAGEEPWAGFEESTLRGYEPYQQFEVWSAENLFGTSCLIAIHRETADVVSTSCVPPSAELFVDVLEHGLPRGARIRFIQRGDSVDAFEYLAAQEP